LAENDKKSAKKYLALAEKNLETLEKMGYSLAMVHAYKSAFWGFKIGISPIKAPFYGSKCLNHANESLNASNKNSFGLVQYGMAYFYMPAMFGGSKKTAVKHFLNALKLMEAKPNDLEHNWNYLNLLTLIGQSYEEIKEYEKSKIHFEQALKKEPDFLWVKKELMPELLKKMK
jgi:tetratricopeptide (TPR) repeat protein